MSFCGVSLAEDTPGKIKKNGVLYSKRPGTGLLEKFNSQYLLVFTVIYGIIKIKTLPGWSI